MFKKKEVSPESESQKILRAGFKKVTDRINYNPENDLSILTLQKKLIKIMRTPQPGILCRLFCKHRR